MVVGGGTCWATAVAAAEASADPVPPTEGATKIEANAVSTIGEAAPRPARRSTVETEADTRATNITEGAELSSILMRGRVRENHGDPKTRKEAHRKQHYQCWDTSPPKPTPGSVKSKCEARRPGLGRYRVHLRR